MSFYWLYDMPNWQMFLLVCGVVVMFSVGGCLLLRDRFDRWLGLSPELNDLVGNFLAFTGMFFSIMLGLVAVGVWDTFNGTQDKVNAEAASLSAIYRDISHFPDSTRHRLQDRLKTYTRMVIDTEWPQQQRGIVPGIADTALGNFGDFLLESPVGSARDQVMMTEALRQYNSLLQARRLRLQSVQEGLPSSLWIVIVIGAMLNVVLSWLFVVRNRYLDILLNMIMALLLGSVLAFVIAMDNPFRGELSIDSSAFETVYGEMMLR